MKVIEADWHSYERQVIPASAPDVQRSESRKAFYAGAICLFHSIISMLDPGEEPTEADLRKMDAIDQELKEYALEVRAQAGGVRS